MTIYSDPHSEITGTEDIIRKGDVQERLESIRPFFAQNDDGTNTSEDFATHEEAEAYAEANPGTGVYSNGDEADEQEALKDLISEWTHGSFMVSHDYLEEFAKDEADDLTSGADYLFPYVDWEKVADAMKMDMSPVEYRGSTYYIRS